MSYDETTVRSLSPRLQMSCHVSGAAFTLVTTVPIIPAVNAAAMAATAAVRSCFFLVFIFPLNILFSLLKNCLLYACH